MSTNYNIFFELTAAHKYYESGRCECLTFEADPETTLLFNRYKIGISMAAGHFRLYSFGRSLADLLGSLTSSSSRAYFEIDIVCNDPTFYNFTELPIGWAGSIEYNTGDTSVPAVNNATKLNPTLSPSAPGCYYAGKILINFSDLAALQAAPQFYIDFTPRATQWQYYVINQSAVELSAPFIEDKQKKTFEGPQHVVTETGQPAMFFSSGELLLPLSNWPQYKFNLLNRQPPKSQGASAAGTTARIVFKGLPNPGPVNVNQVQVNDRQQLSSPMYVYL